MPTVPEEFDADSAVKNYLTTPAEPMRVPGAMRESMAEAVRSKPDEYAEARRIAARTGVPVTAIFENREEIVRQHNFDNFDFSTYEKSFPTSANLLSDTEFAKVAHDDLENMGSLEHIVKSFAAGGAQAVIGLTEGVLRTPQTFSRITAPPPGMPMLGGIQTYMQAWGIIAERSGLNDTADALHSFQSSLPEKYEPFQRLTGKGKQADEAFNAAFEGNLEPMWHVVRDPEAWAAFIGNAVPSIAVALRSGGSIPVMGWLEGMSAANDAAEFEKNTGVKMTDAQFSQAVLQTGIVNSLLEKTGLDAILGVAGKGLSGVLKATLSEGGTEAAQQLNQNVATYLSYNSDQSLKEGILASAMGGAGTGGVVSSGITVINKAVERIQSREAKAQRGEQGAQTVEQLTKLAQSSKLLQRDPESFERFIAAANEDSDVQDIYLDPKELGQAGIDIEKLAALSPSVRKQLAFSTDSGGLLRIPVSEYASSVAASELGQSLLDHAKTDPLGMSRSEAKEFMQSAKEEFEAEIEKTMVEGKQARVFLESREIVYGHVFDQLDTANRFTEDVNHKYASLLSNFYAVQAIRLGITPEEMFNQYPVGVQAQSVVGGFDQLTRRNDLNDVMPEKKPPSAVAAPQEAAQTGQKSQGSIPVEAEGDMVTIGEMLAGVKATEGNPYLQGEETRRGSFNPETSVISLFNAADLSTFLHEAGHFFLETLNAMALDPNAPPEITADMDATLKWLGVESLADWNAKDLEAQREHHEKFARGFEAYLFEGKAPNAELAGIFGRFRDWILMVYKEIRNLNVDLSDDIRGVFDRLLATNESIAEAETIRNFVPLFQSAEEGGLTPDEWAAYQNLGREATEQARHDLSTRTLRDMKWLSNAKDRKLRELQKDAEAKRRSVRREVTKEVMSEPVNQARTFIRKGETTEGVKVEGAHRLDANALKEMYGEGADALWHALESKYGQYGMIGNDGVHPDQVAEIFGFSSGDELVKTLIAEEDAKDKIKAFTDRRMLERYGDITDPKSLERAADVAIHNDARTRFVATEVNVLNRAIGRRKILTTAAKDYAQGMVDRLRVRDVKPSRYIAAEAKAARAAEGARKSGDLELAAVEKRNQLIQMHAAKVAIEAQEEIEKSLRYLRKFESNGTRTKIDQDYLDQIDSLLDRFDLRKSISLKQIDRRTSLLEWFEAQSAVGIEPEIPAELLDAAYRKHYKDISVEEMRGLADTVKQIEHLGRLKERLLTAADNRNFNRTIEDLTDSIYANSKGRMADNVTRPTRGNEMRGWVKEYLASHRKVSSLSRQMDGVKDGGAMWETFIRSMNAAGATEAGLREDATKRLMVLIAPILKQGKMGGAGTFFPSIDRSLNREERISLALNTGNGGNLQRLLDGEGWTLEQIQPVLDTITSEEATFVQSIWDLFESYRPQIAAKEKRIYGIEPEWVEPKPITLGGVELRGGYFPIKYDHRRSAVAEQQNDAEYAKAQMKGAYTSATTRRSFTKSRADEVRGRPLMLTMGGLYNGLNEVIHDLSWHEWLIDANRLLRSKRLDKAIRETYGAEIVKQFKDAVRDIAAGEIAAATAFEKILSHLRHGASVAGLGFNLVSATVNTTGITQSFVRVGPRWVMQGIGEWVANPVGFVRAIYEKSEFMRLRGQTWNREINEVRNMLSDKTQLRTALDRYAYLPMTMTQIVVDAPTWWGAYQKALAAGEEESRAVALADQAVLDAQSGGQIKDLAAVQRGGPGLKLFTTFYSYFSSTFQLTAEVTAKTNFNDPKDVIRLGGDYFLLYVVPAFLSTIISGLLFGEGDDWLEDPESFAKTYANNQLGYLLNPVVGLREASGVLQKGLGVNTYNTSYGGPAGLRFLQEFDKFGQQAGQGELDRALARSVVNVGGIALRLPSSQTNRTIDGIAALIEGNTTNLGAVVTGGPRD